MKKMVKRLFALLLVLSMLSAEIPTSVFAAGTSAQETTGTSSSSQNSGSTSNSAQSSAVASGDGVKIVYNLIAGFKAEQYAVRASLESTNNFWGHAVTTKYSEDAVRMRSNHLYMDVAVNGFSAYVINVPVSDTYDLQINYGALANGGEADVFLIRNAENYLGAASYPNGDNKYPYKNSLIKTAYEGAVALDSANADSAAALNVGAINCYNTAGTTASPVSSGDKSFGEVYLEAGTHLVVFRATASHASDGEANIHVRRITLSAGDGAVVMKMTSSVGKDVIMPNVTTQITATAYLSNPSVTNLVYTYTSSNPAVATVSESGVVTGVAEGTTEITVAAVLDGKTLATSKQTVTVRMPDLTGYKFVYDLNTGLTSGLDARTVTFAATHNFWAYGADNASAATVKVDANGVVAALAAAGQYVAFKVNVPVKGNYQLLVNHALAKTGAVADVYVIPASTADVASEIANRSPNGAVDFYAATAAVSADTTVGTVDITAAGEYLVVFKTRAQTSGSTGWQVMPNVISLVDGDAAYAMEIVEQLDNASVKVGQKLTFGTSVYISDPEIDPAEVKIAYEALDAYLEVNDAGVVRVVNADSNAIKNARIRITVSVYGKIAGTKDITLQIAPFQSSGVKLTYNWKNWQLHGSSVRDIDFVDTKGFWSYYADYAVNIDGSAIRPMEIQDGYGFFVPTWDPYRWFALKISVPVSGDYRVIQNYATSKDGAVGNVYILPGNIAAEDLHAMMKSGAANAPTPVGTIDFYSTDSKNRQEELTSVSLEAGEYLVVYRTNAKGAGGNAYLTPGMLTLQGGDGLTTIVESVADQATLMIGDSTQISAMANLSDMSAAEYTFGYASANNAVLTVDSNGKVTAVGAGKTNVVVTAYLNGSAVATDTVAIDVVDPDLTGYKIVYDFDAYLQKGTSVRDVTTLLQTHMFWAYVKDTAPSDAKLSVDTAYGLNIPFTAAGQYLALKLNVPANGDYHLSMTHAASTDGAVAGVYILPGNTTNIDAALQSAASVGTVDFYKSVKTTGLTTDLGSLTLTKGEYILVLKTESHTTGSTGWKIYPGALSLADGDMAAIMDISTSTKENILTMGLKTQLTVKLYLSNPDALNVAIKYKSQDKYTSVDENGVITIVAAESDATVDTSILVTIEAFKKEVGTTLFTAQVKEFKASGIKLDVNYRSGFTYGTPVRGITFANTHGFWEYYTSDAYTKGTTIERPIQIHSAWGIEAQTWYANQWFAIKIKVPKAGDYVMSMDYRTMASGALSEVYVLPGATQKDAIGGMVVGSNAVKPVGTVDFYSAKTGSGNASFGTVTFAEAGEYIVVYKAVSKGGDGKGDFYMTPGTLHLYGGEGIAVVSLEAKTNKTSLKEGDIDQITATTYMSDGSNPEYVYRFESLNEFADVSRSGVITGTKTGTAQIKVTVVTQSETVSTIVSLPITTINPAGVSHYYDFLYGFSYGTEVRNITYANTLNTWEYYADGDTTQTRPVFIHTGFGAWYQNSRNFHWIAYKINVPSAGDYLMSVRHGVWNTGAVAGVYIMPGDTPKDEISKNFNESTKINEIAFGKKGGLITTTTQLGIINIPAAGEYIVVYRPLQQSTHLGISGWNMYMGSITLDGVNCLKNVTPEDNFVNLNWGETYNCDYTLRLLNGTVVDPATCTITYRSDDPMIASVDVNGVVKGESHGTTTIYITAYDGVESHTGSFTVNVTDNSGIKSAYIDVESQLYLRETALAPLTVVLNSGNHIRLESIETIMTVTDGSILAINSGTITAKAVGTATVRATSEFLGEAVSAELAITVVAHEGKTEPTYYTYEMRNNAKENIVKYDWAQDARDTAVKSARYYLRSWKTYYDSIMKEGVPRSRQVGFKYGEYRKCRYCGADVMELYGASGIGGWAVDPVEHPWKVQCKDCLRWFPSNDFESFYKLGLDENGMFDYEKAWAENEKLKASGHAGYLVNELYPEKGEGWGVDDGYGWRVYKDGSEMYPFFTQDPNLDKTTSSLFVAMYAYYYWTHMRVVITAFTNAYVYTGEIEYARAGAILLDRVADVLPDYNLRNYFYGGSVDDLKKYDFVLTCGDTLYGSLVGCIDDPIYFRQFALAADAFFPILNDPYVIKFLSKKAQELGLENDKSSSQKIWQNWRDNLLYETYEASNDGRLKGNFGLQHYALSAAAIVIAEEPETTLMLDWLLACDSDYLKTRTSTGGDILGTYIRLIDRDGMGNEASPGYNCIWLKMLYSVADDMALYTDGGDKYNLYANPKFLQSFLNYGSLILSDSHHVQIGDSGSVASLDFSTNNNMFISVWKAVRNTPYARRVAQTLYIVNGYSVANLKYGTFEKDPLSIQAEIMQYVDKHEKKYSEMLSGFGYSVIRDGFTGDSDSMRSAWLYYSINSGHGHKDTLNLGIEAFGLNIAPDLGYPPNTIGDNTNTFWMRSAVAHNTVAVDESDGETISKAQYPYLFDDSEYVDVMGVETDGVYRQCKEYKRTVVQVKVDGDNSYYVDFFRVLGGEQHTYSFHAQSQGAMAMDGLDPEMQVDENGNLTGTYAGADVPFNTRGDFYSPYSFMTKVRKDSNPEDNQFTVDFKITDYRGAISNNNNIHLKMTQINNFVPDEVAIVGGHVPVKKDNAPITEETDTLEYVLTQRKSKNGEDLDSLFTTVFEPYRGTSYITSITEAPVKVVSGKPGATDNAKALVVAHKSGRIDYVFYASNNEVTYRVADTFNVKGYVGVYSLDGKQGTEVFRYVVGGDIIVEAIDQIPVFKGNVQNFSTDMVLNGNFIDVNLDPSVADQLAGRYIYVENDRVQNGVYKIVSAKPNGDGVRLDLGTVSLIRGLRDNNNLDSGYVYNIAKGQRFEIPMPYTKCDLDTTARLMHLEIVGATLTPAFDPEVVDYTSFVGEEVRTLGFRAAASMPNATVKIEKGAEVHNTGVVDEIAIGKKTKIEVTVTAEDGMTTKTYFITITKADHFCWGGTAYCDEKAVCVKCGSHYGDIAPDNHREVELWNGKYATKDSDGYSGDYYCTVCHLLASKGHVLVYQPPVNTGMILLIAAGVVLVGGGATAATILVVKKRKVSTSKESEQE